MASDKQATVKITADGNVMSCAKGLAGGECGYESGAPVCGKCGAMAVEVKYGMMGNGEEMMQEVMPKKKKKKRILDDPMMDEKAATRAYGDVYEDDEEEMDEEDEEMDEEDPLEGEPNLSETPVPQMAEESTDDQEDLLEAIAAGRPPMRKGRPMGSMQMMDDEEEEESVLPEDEEMTPPEQTMMPQMRRRMGMEEQEEEMEEPAPRPNMSEMRNRRLSTMGFKEDEFGPEPFVCSIERKLYPGNSKVCENCPGGCKSEGDMPALLEVEGMAEDIFSGKVLDSGYSDSADIFVVDVERKDGKPVEAFFDGTTGECMGWHLLNEEVMQVKSAFEAPQLISFSEAADMATKSIAGDVVSIEADNFEGYDSYAVEIEGVDGKSYDVFVSLDGEVLGYDTYTQEEALSIEAEAAEIALKRAHDDVARKAMAQTGEAMEDGEMPIKNSADLRNAIMAWERSKNRDAAKLHIMKRAMELGLEGSLPAQWVAEGLEEKKSEADFMSSLLEFEMISADSDENDQERLAEIYFKKMFTDDRREELAKMGMALPDGSYPIESEEDLKNAIQAFGRAKDKEAAKAHIMKRAKALGKEDLIPDNWR